MVLPEPEAPMMLRNSPGMTVPLIFRMMLGPVMRLHCLRVVFTFTYTFFHVSWMEVREAAKFSLSASRLFVLPKSLWIDWFRSLILSFSLLRLPSFED